MKSRANSKIALYLVFLAKSFGPNENFVKNFLKHLMLNIKYKIYGNAKSIIIHEK